MHSYMDRTNLEMYCCKNVLGILINERATNHPLKEKTTLSKRGKGKGKCKKSISEVLEYNHGSERGFFDSQVNFFELEDD